MRNTTPVIVGAGLAGLLAAHAWPGASLVEAAARPTEVHKAVLRFRTRNVANLVGIEFRAVRVHKGIWQSTKFVEPNIRSANLYAQKVQAHCAATGAFGTWPLWSGSLRRIRCMRSCSTALGTECDGARRQTLRRSLWTSLSSLQPRCQSRWRPWTLRQKSSSAARRSQFDAGASLVQTFSKPSTFRRQSTLCIAPASQVIC